MPPASLPLIPSQAELARGATVRGMFAGIARRYDLANHLLSGGLDFFWRRHTARAVHALKPERILDLATGSGDLALTLRATCPGSLVIGADFCPPMLAEARRKGLLHLIAADGLQLPFATGAFDILTVAFGLRNMASWSGALLEMNRVLRVGGHLFVLDFSLPPQPLAWLYRPYLRLVLPRLADLLTGQKAAYEYLGESIEAFPHGQAMCRLIEAAGFSATTATSMTGGIVTLYSGRRAASPAI